MANQLLRVEDVHKAYAVNPVLRGISLAVDAHEVVVLVGASGSGKSTLLRCINGLEAIDAGRIMLDNTLEVSAPHADLDAVRQRVGIVFQSFNLFPHLSVLDNVTLAPRKVRGTSRKVAEDAARELLSRFGLGDKADSFPDRLSGGQQQRVAIVRALAMDPELMLFDEITSALDPQLVGEVLDVVRELSESGMTIVMATHEMTFAREVAHRICFLDAGSMLEEGPPDQVFDNPLHERTREFLSRTKTR
jgi:polar amino acid transport system ATP-binding protein